MPLNQQFLDHNTLTASVTTRYSLSDVGNLLMVMSGVDNIFTNQEPGLPSNNSKYYALLGGADYQAKGVWRYRVLVGVQVATFEASQYNSSIAPVAQASAVWNPTGLITLTGTLTRSVQPAQSEGSNGFVLTSAGLIVDYEYERNIIFQGRGSLQYAQYLQSGSQTNTKIGAGVSWLLNRNLRLSFDYDYTKLTGSTGFSNPSNPNTVTTSQYSEGLGILALHVAF